jgi:hypothetical protein
MLTNWPTSVFNTLLENSMRQAPLNIALAAFFLLAMTSAIFSGLLLSNDDLALMGIQLDEEIHEKNDPAF